MAFETTAVNELIPVVRRVAFAVACVLTSSSAFAQQQTPARSGAHLAEQSYSNWDLQLLYGWHFREPGKQDSIGKTTITLENSTAWTWGSSYFFVDFARSNAKGDNATDVYAEFYPSASLSKLLATNLSVGPLRDSSATMGVNAGTSSTGAVPLIYLPGLTFDFKIPGFKFFSLGTYAYIDQGRIHGASNGSNSTTYQVTPSWSLPFRLGPAKLLFDGFVDFVGSHGQCASQVVAQPAIRLDLGSLWSKPGRFYAGIEWQYWHNKFGISGLKESTPQIVLMRAF